MGIRQLLVSALFCVIGFAQTAGPVNVWTPRGPEGGLVGRPVIAPRNPGTLYLGVSGRLLKTTDAAGHWSDLGALPVTILAVDPQDSNALYGSSCASVHPQGAVCPENVLFKSSDGGLTWNPISASFPSQCGSLALVIDPSDPNTLYAGCSGPMVIGGGGVFKSMDGGTTWSAASAGLPPFQDATVPLPPYVAVNTLSIDPKHPGTLYATLSLSRSSSGIFKSTDGAVSWSPINSGLPVHFSGSVTIDPQEPNTLYTSDARDGLFKSTDGGSNWAIVSTEAIPQGLLVDPEDSGTLYGLSYNGLVKSADGGGNWRVILPDVGFDLTESGWLAVAPGDGGASTVYAGGTPRGVFKSPDGGSTWATANSGLNATWIDSVAIDPQNPRTVYAGVSDAGLFRSTGGGLFRSTDGASTWSPAPVLAARGIVALAFYPPNPGIVYAGTSDGVQKSLDDGQSWAGLPLDPDDEEFFGVAIDFQNPGTIYAGSFKSTDGGASWVQLAGNLTTLATDSQNSGTIYAGSDGGTPPAPTSSGVLKSVDGGATWSGVNTLWQAVHVATVAVDPTDSNVVYAQTGYFLCVYPPYGGCSLSTFPDGYGIDPAVLPVVLQALGVYKSADGGATWMKLDLPGVPADHPVVALLGIDQQGGLYVWLSAQASLIRSQDGGATWNGLPTTGLPLPVHALAIDPQNPNHLFAGTQGEGVFEITLSPTQQ